MPVERATRQNLQVTSFGPTGLVVLHLLSELKMLRDVPVITITIVLWSIHLSTGQTLRNSIIQSYASHLAARRICVSGTLR